MINSQSAVQQYYFDKLGLDRYQLKPQYAPKMTLCFVGMLAWQPKLRELGDAIIAAVTRYCPDCNVQSLSSIEDLAAFDHATVVLAEEDFKAVAQTPQRQVFMIEQLLNAPALKRRLWQSCFYG